MLRGRVPSPPPGCRSSTFQPDSITPKQLRATEAHTPSESQGKITILTQTGVSRAQPSRTARKHACAALREAGERRQLFHRLAAQCSSGPPHRHTGAALRQHTSSGSSSPIVMAKPMGLRGRSHTTQRATERERETAREREGERGERARGMGGGGGGGASH